MAGPRAPCPLVSSDLALRINKPTSTSPFEIGCGPVLQGKGSTQATAMQTMPGTGHCLPPVLPPSMETPTWNEVGAKLGTAPRGSTPSPCTHSHLPLVPAGSWAAPAGSLGSLPSGV